MNILDFDQKAFITHIFTFMRENNIEVRDFCARAGCSPTTLYRAKDAKSPLQLDTIRRLNDAVASFPNTGDS